MEDSHYPDHQAKRQRMKAFIPPSQAETEKSEKEILREGHCMRIPVEVIREARQMQQSRGPLQSIAQFVGSLFS